MAFKYNPEDGYRNTTVFPTKPANETAFRNSMMTLLDQVAEEINTGSESGWSSVGMSRQSGINFNFDIWQRGLSANNPSTGSYLCDQFQTLLTNSGTMPTTVTHSRGTLSAGEIPGSLYYYRINPSGAGSGFGVNDVCQLRSPIENGTRYLCGDGKKITVSFYARSSIPGKKIGVYLAQTYGSGGSPSASESINGTTFDLTSSWAKYSHTFTTSTLSGKTLGTNNDDYLGLNISVMWGSAFGDRFNSPSTETFGGSGLIDIAQVQMNSGDTALPFQPRSVAEELWDCQRYCNAFYDAVSTSLVVGQGIGVTSTAASIEAVYPREMRIKPTLVATPSDWQLVDGVTTPITLTGLSHFTNNNTPRSTLLNATASGITLNRPYFLMAAAAGSRLIFDATL